MSLEVDFFARMTKMAIVLARKGQPEYLDDEDKLLLRQVLALGWKVNFERPYRCVVTGPEPQKEVLVFDERHNSINISGAKRGVLRKTLR